MTNHWSFIIKKTLYYNDLDTEDFILHPVNSDDNDNDDDDNFYVLHITSLIKP